MGRGVNKGPGGERNGGDIHRFTTSRWLVQCKIWLDCIGLGRVRGRNVLGSSLAVGFSYNVATDSPVFGPGRGHDWSQQVGFEAEGVKARVSHVSKAELGSGIGMMARVGEGVEVLEG